MAAISSPSLAMASFGRHRFRLCTTETRRFRLCTTETCGDRNFGGAQPKLMTTETHEIAPKKSVFSTFFAFRSPKHTNFAFLCVCLLRLVCFSIECLLLVVSQIVHIVIVCVCLFVFDWLRDRFRVGFGWVFSGRVRASFSGSKFVLC